MEVTAHACTLPPRDLQGRVRAVDESSQKNAGLSPMPSLPITLTKLPGMEYKLGTKRRGEKKNRRDKCAMGAMCQVQCELHFVHTGRPTFIFLIIVAQRS